MLTFGLSVNSGCAGTKLFTKDWSYTTHKGLLSQLLPKADGESYPVPQWVLDQAPGLLLLQNLLPYNWHTLGKPRDFSGKWQRKETMSYTEIMARMGGMLFWHWASHAEITILCTAHRPQHRCCYSCWFLQTLTSRWWKVKMDTLSSLNVFDSKYVQKRLINY